MRKHPILYASYRPQIPGSAKICTGLPVLSEPDQVTARRVGAVPTGVPLFIHKLII
jgi:hypothetical protein